MNKKSGSYYKYAIGEIILVVIGILIAIQVDAWYKMKTEQEEINSYLLSIQREFEIEIYFYRSKVNTPSNNQNSGV